MKSTRFYKLTPGKAECTSTLEILKSITDFIRRLLLYKKNEWKAPKSNHSQFGVKYRTKATENAKVLSEEQTYFWEIR